jgi:hypothetical protein
MRARSLKVFILALVTFLQCLSPLIHAHAREASATGHAHFHLDDLALADHASAAGVVIAPAGHHSAAIGVSQEFKRDFPLLPVVVFVALLFFAAGAPRRVRPLRTERSGFVAAPLHSRPPATAPPVRAA